MMTDRNVCCFDLIRLVLVFCLQSFRGVIEVIKHGSRKFQRRSDFQRAHIPEHIPVLNLIIHILHIADSSLDEVKQRQRFFREPVCSEVDGFCFGKGHGLLGMTSPDKFLQIADHEASAWSAADFECELSTAVFHRNARQQFGGFKASVFCSGIFSFFLIFCFFQTCKETKRVGVGEIRNLRRKLINLIPEQRDYDETIDIQPAISGLHGPGFIEITICCLAGKLISLKTDGAGDELSMCEIISHPHFSG